eukprot:4952195-Prymnesium_polylepis.2
MKRTHLDQSNVRHSTGLHVKWLQRVPSGAELRERALHERNELWRVDDSVVILACVGLPAGTAGFQ